MASLNDTQRSQLMSLFRMADFSGMYDIINQEYKRRELGGDLYDDERIAEYQYINQQLRKFVSSKQDQILSHGADLQGMMDEVESIISTASEYGSSRKELVYIFVRDAWLLSVLNGIAWLIENDEEE